MNTVFYILSAVLGAALALGTYIFVRKILLKGQKEEIIKKAELEAESIKKEKIFQAKEKFLQLKSEHEQYINERNKQIGDIENRLKQKESALGQQSSELGRKNKEAEALKENLKAQLEAANNKKEEYEKLREDAIRQIEEIAGMTATEAKNQLMESMKAEARTQAQSYINDALDEARLTASKDDGTFADDGRRRCPAGNPLRYDRRVCGTSQIQRGLSPRQRPRCHRYAAV